MVNSLSTADTHERQVASIQQDIHKSIEQLPLESLKVLQQFAEFLEQQTLNKRQPDGERQPLKLVPVPASRLTGLIGLLSPGYEGNALEDTEAYFDDIEPDL